MSAFKFANVISWWKNILGSYFYVGAPRGSVKFILTWVWRCWREKADISGLIPSLTRMVLLFISLHTELPYIIGCGEDIHRIILTGCLGNSVVREGHT